MSIFQVSVTYNMLLYKILPSALMLFLKLPQNYQIFFE